MNNVAKADDEFDQLREEIRKLKIINQALMGQVERSMDFQGNAFTLFQTAIGLENRVSERTQELENALAELEKTNRALNQAKEVAETAQAHLALSIENISEGFALFDSDDKLILFNAKFHDIWPHEEKSSPLGLTFEEFLRTLVHHNCIEDAHKSPETWIAERLIAHRRPGPALVTHLSDGRWLQVSERPTEDGGIVGIYTDITEIKRTETKRREQALAEKSLLLQATLDHIDHGVSVFDRNNTLTAWNQRFAELIGLNKDDLYVGRTQSSFLPPSEQQAERPDQTALFATLNDITNDHLTPSVRFEQKCSDNRILEVRRNPMPDGGFVATYADITHSKRTEEALRDSERRIRLVTDAMPALIAYVDKNEYYQFTNKAFETWFDRPRSEINGRPMQEVLGQKHYDQRSAYVRQALDGMEVTFEMSNPSERLSIEYALATYFPHFNAEGEVLGFFALIQDITERRKNAIALQEAKANLERRVEERTGELLTVNQELAEAKALAEHANLSKTRFLAAASHDLLQPLNAARVFVAALSEKQLNDENAKLVHNITNAMISVEELLTALLEISKLDAGVFETSIEDFPIGPLIWSLANEHAPIAQNKGLRLSAAPSSAVVRTDSKLLSRLLRNFITNAIRYTSHGRILIGCRPHGNCIRVGVWDTGIGIPQDQIADIFQEFRRLPNVDTMDSGVGLGLAIVERIAKRLDLELEVQSAPGKGSMFAIDIPLGDRAAVKPKKAELSLGGTNKLSGAVILLIDNEQTILDAMEALLSNWSVTTINARNTKEALAHLKDHDQGPDLVLVDYHLDDGEVGLEALSAVRKIYGEDIPAIVATADRTEEVSRAADEMGAFVMNKPLKPGRLRSLITHVLAGRDQDV